MKCDLCGGNILEEKVVGDDPLCHECYRKVYTLKCDLCGGVVLENKTKDDNTLCHECYCKVYNIFELKFKTIRFATISIILSVFAIFSNVKIMKEEEFNWIFVLIANHVVACLLVTVIFKLKNNQIKHPYIVALMITCTLGVITIANMPNPASLEMGIGVIVISLITIISSIVVGILIGRYVNGFERQKERARVSNLNI